MRVRELTSRFAWATYTAGGDMLRPAASAYVTVTEHFIAGTLDGQEAYTITVYEYPKSNGDYFFEVFAQIRNTAEQILTISTVVTTTSELHAATQSICDCWIKLGHNPFNSKS